MHEFSIEILAPAWHEIEEIADMHLSLVGPASAKKITDKILNHIELLKDNPFIGTCPFTPRFVLLVFSENYVG